MLSGLNIAYIAVVLGILLVSISVHEMMHAYVAYKLGDSTAEHEGRLTLNPFAHIDPILTIAMPAVLLVMGLPPIIAAKPVPFRPDLVKGGEFGSAAVAIAGPISNFLQAALGSLVLRMGLVDPGTIIFAVVDLFVQINIAIFIFNLIPFPPLDGSRVLYAFAPDGLRRIMNQIEQFGIFIFIGVLLLAYQYIAPVLGNMLQAVYYFLV